MKNGNSIIVDDICSTSFWNEVLPVRWWW